MVSTRSLSVDRSIGPEADADDYLPKPFERPELLARVRAILRRGGLAKHANFLLGGFTSDRGRRAAFDRERSP